MIFESAMHPGFVYKSIHTGDPENNVVFHQRLKSDQRSLSPTRFETKYKDGEFLQKISGPAPFQRVAATTLPAWFRKRLWIRKIACWARTAAWIFIVNISSDPTIN